MFDFMLPKVPQVEVKDLLDAIEKKEEFVLLDVRTNQEYLRGKISGSINLPLDEVNKKVQALIPDKEKLIYVYCLSGSRSAVAVSTMIKLGYKNVFDIKNGFLAWRGNNFPIAS